MATISTTQRLTFDEAVSWSYDHTGHFTDGPSHDMCIRLANTSVPRRRTVQWTSPHGETCTVTFDAGDGFCWVRAS